MNTELPGFIKSQYIELLIRLIELNGDHSWLDAFLKLREGKYLPGGGAGSLNDWGPYYSGIKPAAWYGFLYNIMRQLFDRERLPEEINNLKDITTAGYIQVSRCLNCGKSYQHPSVFEVHLAARFYKEFFAVYTRNGRLPDILKPELSFNNADVLRYRDQLLRQYAGCAITIYDFLFAGYSCPHCNILKPLTEHDKYKVEEDGTLRLLPPGADW